MQINIVCRNDQHQMLSDGREVELKSGTKLRVVGITSTHTPLQQLSSVRAVKVGDILEYQQFSDVGEQFGNGKGTWYSRRLLEGFTLTRV